MKIFKAILWIILYVAIYLAISFIVSLVATIAMLAGPIMNAILSGGISAAEYNSLVSGAYEKLSTTMQSPLSVLISLITLFVFVCFMHARGKHDRTTPTYIKAPGALNVWTALIAGFFFNILISYIYGIILSNPALSSAAADYSSASASLYQGSIFWQVLAVAICPPIVEEFLFRGLIMGKLCSIMPTSAAIIIQAMIFASMHNGVIWMSYALVMGLFLGWICAKTRSLFASMAFHAAFNAASFMPGIELESLWLFIILSACVVIAMLAIMIIHLNNPKLDKKEVVINVNL